MAEEDELGSFFAEINEITAQVEESKSENVANISAESDVPPFKKALPSSQPISIVYSKAPELREVAVKASHAVYTYDQPELHQLGENYAEDQPQYSAAAHYSQPPPPPPPAAPFIPRSNKTFVRKAADEVWVDETLQEWPENDFRIFVGDLAKETTTEILTKHFQTYKSFAKAKVIIFFLSNWKIVSITNIFVVFLIHL